VAVVDWRNSFVVVGELQASSSNLEVFVERTDGLLQHDEHAGINWVPGPTIA
jgi:hypothetical protein